MKAGKTSVSFGLLPLGVKSGRDEDAEARREVTSCRSLTHEVLYSLSRSFPWGRIPFRPSRYRQTLRRAPLTMYDGHKTAVHKPSR